MTVLFFGVARDLVGAAHSTLDIDGELSVSEFWNRLIELHPGLSECRAYSRLAADLDYLEPDQTIRPETREVAIIPPVSGG